MCDGGTCINTEGGVVCECPEGYLLSPSGLKCVDVREEMCYGAYRRG